MRFDSEYLAFALTNCGLVILIFALPLFADAWNPERLTQLSLVILAPFCVIGILALCRVPRLITQTGGGSLAPGRKSYAVASVFLVILLLLNTGFVSALAGEPIQSPAPALFHEQYSLLFLHPQDVAGAKWLGSAIGEGSVYGGYYSAVALLAYSNVPAGKINDLVSFPSQNKTTFYRPSQNNTTYYIYVRSSDIAHIEQSRENSTQLRADDLPSTQFLGTLNKVYDSGCAIYTT